MSKKLFILMSFVFVMCVLSSNVLAVDPNIVGYWNFEDTGGAMAWDSSGYGHDGTFLGDAGIGTDTERGNVLIIDGNTTDKPYVRINDFDYTNSSHEFSLGFWFKTAGAIATTQMPYMFNHGSGVDYTYNNLDAYIRSTTETNIGCITTRIILDGTGVAPSASRWQKTTTKRYDDGEWHYYAVTLSTTGATVYVDGDVVSSGLMPGIGTPLNPTQGILLGARDTLSDNPTVGRFFNGRLDDVKLYNKALTRKELLETAGINTARGQSPDGGTNLAVAQTLSWIAAYEESRTFNVYYGIDPNNVKDSQPGSLIGGTTLVTTGVGVTSLARTFNPATTYYWRVDVVDGGTVYADEKIHTFSTNVANSYNFLPANAQGGLNPIRTILSWTAGSLAVTGYNVYLGTNQVAVTNGTGGTKVASLQTSTSYTQALVENTTYYWRVEDVGTGTVSSAVMSFTTGSATDPNIVGWWNFESVAGTAVSDASGNNHTGTLTGNATVVTDAVRGNVLSLDGTGDYVVVTGYKGIGGANPRTISAWIKTAKTGTNYQGIVAWGTSAAGQSWDFVVYNSKMRQMVYNNNANGAINVADGNWHHVASVFGGGNLNTVKIYVDSVLDTVTSASIAVNTGSTRNVRIGDTDSTSGRQFQGMLDDVRMYNRVVDAPEIYAIYHEGDNYTTIDNMEDYNEITKPINGTGGWLDNAYNPNPGGHTYIGRTATLDQVKSGVQSLKFAYDNFDWAHWTYYNSETVKIFATSQDWSYATSEKKVKILTIPVRGLATNGADKLYTALEDELGHSFTIYHSDPNVLINETWQIWEIPLSSFTNVNLTKVKKIFLGVGNRNDANPPATWLAGTVYFDELTLNPPRCRADLAKPLGDVTNNCVVNLADVRIMANNWLTSDITVVPEAVSTDSLKVQWTFDAGNAVDSSGNGHTGTVTNAIPVSNDPVRGAVMNFDGTGYISMPSAAFSSISNEITISLWQNGGTVQPINCSIINGDEGTGNRILNVHLPWGSGAVIWDAGLAGTAYDRVSKAATANQYKGQWNHWAFTKNATTGQMKIYLNGQLWSSGTGMTKSMSGITRFNVGASASGTLNFYNGMVDELRIYGRVLSDGEIVTLAGYTQPLVIPVNATVNLKVKGVAGQETIDYRDFSVIADNWFKEVLWP